MMMQNRGYRKQHYNYLNLLILKPALLEYRPDL